MAISVILENGSGITNATTYLSVQEFRDHGTQRGISYATYPDSTIGVWVNDATEYSDSYYRYGGVKASDTQALEVPRTGWYDKNGISLDNTVPVQLKKAVYYLSSERRGVSPETSVSTGIKAKKIGPVSITYSKDSGSKTTTYTKANACMKGLLKRSTGNLCLPK